MVDMSTTLGPMVLPNPVMTASGCAGSGNGRPSGPTTSTGSWARSPVSHTVPGPCAATTTSTVPP